MPKLNARENTRNRANAKKRKRNRELRASLQVPVQTTGKPAAKTSDKSAA